MKEFQNLFALLQHSNKKFVSPEALTGLLQIQTSIQQDVQEFNSLLLNYVEDILKKCGNEDLHNAISKEFEGKSMYKTKCRECDNVTCTATPFMELNISINDKNNMKQGLKDIIKVEELSGVNQYQCDKCGKLVDADRRRVFEDLPPVLNLQLLRFIYDPETYIKKKLNNPFSFPQILDLRTYCNYPNGESIEDNIYELSAVLLHLGESPLHGHYVAQIRDESTNNWYTFDDINISPCDIENVGDIKQDKEWKKVSSESKNLSINNRQFTSENAYMLIYTKKSRNIVEAPQPPQHILENVNQNNEILMSLVNSWRSEFDKEEAVRVSHKQEYDEFIRLAPISGSTGNRKFCWISKDWLSNWIKNGDSNIEIDNSGLLCSHEKVNPAMLGNMKQISMDCWKFLHDNYGGGPVLTDEDCCLSCAITLSDGMYY